MLSSLREPYILNIVLIESENHKTPPLYVREMGFKIVTYILPLCQDEKDLIVKVTR